MQSQAKSSKIKLLDGSGVRKNLDPKSETRKTAYIAQTMKFGKAMYRLGRAGSKRKRPDPINQAI